MFAALNVMEYMVCEKYNLEAFELSQNYTLFYDKLERANYFFQAIIETADQDIHDRLPAHLLTDPLGDGGQWDMLKNIIKKYGVVPKYAMPETENSSATSSLNNYLTKLLRMYAKDLRQALAAGKDKASLEDKVAGYLREVHRVLSIALGTPPSRVNFEARDKEDKFISYPDLTPCDFFHDHVGMELDDYISLINAPTRDKPYYKSYTVAYLGNIVEGDPIHYINVPLQEMKRSLVKQLQAGEPVWFGCDVGQFFSRKASRLDLTTLAIEDLFGLEFNFSKEERLDYKDSCMTHAMVFMGCNYDPETETIDRYRVENSWGKDVGQDGFWVMSDDWFDEYMYQVLINKKYLSREVLEAAETEPIELAPWDPMGSLASC